MSKYTKLIRLKYSYTVMKGLTEHMFRTFYESHA